ncbi:MAG: hypothetical protein ABL901_21545 [Hyphomicrobiaceae bacterium]
MNLNIESPGWDDARGYLFEMSGPTLYFPVAKKYLPENPEKMRVLIGHSPRKIAEGELMAATSQDDAARQLELAILQGMEESKARYMIFDSRSGRPRKTRYKLIVARILCVQEFD